MRWQEACENQSLKDLPFKIELNSRQNNRLIQTEVECSIAPEICIEVMSMSNTSFEMAEKRALYFECGAREVWICGNDGNIEFYTAKGQMKPSKIVLNFPNKI